MAETPGNKRRQPAPPDDEFRQYNDVRPARVSRSGGNRKPAVPQPRPVAGVALGWAGTGTAPRTGGARSRSTIRQMLGSRAAIRRAVLLGEILGQPRALQALPGDQHGEHQDRHSEYSSTERYRNGDADRVQNGTHQHDTHQNGVHQHGAHQDAHQSGAAGRQPTSGWQAPALPPADQPPLPAAAGASNGSPDLGQAPRVPAVPPSDILDAAAGAIRGLLRRTGIWR
ncbi:MAG: hypothetical protein AB7P40_17115 [Chloroflexota bacterium]